jgi:hypothetical protein
MWTAYRWTGDAKYLAPIESVVNKGDHGALSLLNANALDVLGKRESWGRDLAKGADAGKGGDARDNGARPLDFGRFIAWQMSGDKRYLEDLYTSEVTTDINRMYMVTEGEMWSDRVELFSDLLQRSRLGGMALRRNQLYPGHLVSWRFAGSPTAAEDVAILIEDASPAHFRVVAYNLSNKPVSAVLTGQNVVAGDWAVVHAVEPNGKMTVLAQPATIVPTFAFGRDTDVPLVFPPHQTISVEFTLRKEGAPVSARPDIGIGPADIHVGKGSVDVVVHSLGAQPTPPGTLTVKSAAGRPIASVPVPAMEAPVDLRPRTVAVHLAIPDKMSLMHARIAVALSGNPAEITLRNNSLTLP